MIFTQLTAEEFTQFAQQHPQFSFLQTVENAHRRSLGGYSDILYYGVRKDDQLIAAGLFTGRKWLGPYKVYDCPQGFLADYRDQELLNFFTQALKKVLRKQHGISLLIEPNLILQQRDIHGDLVVGGIDNRDVVAHLQAAGYRQLPFNPDSLATIRWKFIKDLQQIDNKEALLRSFDAKTRNHIRTSAASGAVIVRPATRDELPVFLACLDQTAQRRGFDNRDLKYFETLWDVYVPKHGQFMLAELDIPVLRAFLEQRVKEEDTLIEALMDQQTQKPTKKTSGMLREAQIRRQGAIKRLDELEHLPTDRQKILLSAAFFFIYPQEMVYFLSGSDQAYSAFGGAALIQWKMLQSAVERGIPTYDFFGTNGNFNGVYEQEGVYQFKKGFGGNVIELLGLFELTLNPFIQTIRNLLRKVRH